MLRNSFKEFLRIQKIAYPNKDQSTKIMEFYRALATALGKTYQKDPELNKEYFDLTIEALNDVLQIDSKRLWSKLQPVNLLLQ